MIDAIVVDLGGVAARYYPERRSRALATATALPERELDRGDLRVGARRVAELGECQAAKGAGGEHFGDRGAIWGDEARSSARTKRAPSCHRVR
jgi:hypothetical protein